MADRAPGPFLLLDAVALDANGVEVSRWEGWRVEGVAPPDTVAWGGRRFALVWWQGAEVEYMEEGA